MQTGIDEDATDGGHQLAQRNGLLQGETHDGHQLDHRNSLGRNIHRRREQAQRTPTRATGTHAADMAHQNVRPPRFRYPRTLCWEPFHNDKPRNPGYGGHTREDRPRRDTASPPFRTKHLGGYHLANRN